MNTSNTCVSFCLPDNFARVSQDIGWFGTLRGRVGLASGPVLSYVTGGFAFGGVETVTSTALAGAANRASSDETATGYTFGSGVEAALGGNWTAKLEYLYVNLGVQDQGGGFVVVPGIAGYSLGTHTEIEAHVFRGGINYRFGGPGNYSAPLGNWAGFYLGGNVGAGVGNDETTHVFTPGTGLGVGTSVFSLAPEGFVGGGQVGYNWQVGAWVIGVEADFQGTTLKDNRSCVSDCALAANAFDKRLNWFGTARGRLGYSVGSTLFYGTGGFAYGETELGFAQTLGGSGVATFENARGGYAVGGGIESPFNVFNLFGPNWTAKTEYLFVDLGSSTDVVAFAATGQANTITSNSQTHIFRTGINYHFAPVAMR
jgi:outer membrane immunogenic protein